MGRDFGVVGVCSLCVLLAFGTGVINVSDGPAVRRLTARLLGVLGGCWWMLVAICVRRMAYVPCACMEIAFGWSRAHRIYSASMYYCQFIPDASREAAEISIQDTLIGHTRGVPHDQTVRCRPERRGPGGRDGGPR